METRDLFASDEDFYDAMLRVVCISELPRDRDYLPEIYHYLINCFFVENENGPNTVEEVKKGVYDTFGIELSLRDTENILKKRRNIFVFREGKYFLEESAYSALNGDIQKAKSTNERFFDCWREYLENKCSWLTKKEIEWLAEDMKAFLTYAIKNHGYELLELLIPAGTRTPGNFKTVSAEIFRYLPERNKDIREIREVELIAFLRQANIEVRSFLESLFHSSMIMLSVYSDIDLTPYLKSILGGGELFLDTNVIYCLVGLDLPDMKDDYENVLRSSSDLGFNICIHELTVEEYEASLAKNTRTLSTFAGLEKRLRDIVGDLTADPDLHLEYLEAFNREKWVRPAQFVAYYTDIKSLLSDLGVKFLNTNAYEEIKKQSVKNEIGKLIDYYRSMDYKDRGVDKEFEVLRHDAYSKYYVERKRPKTKKFTDLKYWFLSRDRGLTEYAKFAARGSKTFPFSVSVGNWARLLKPYVSPKSERTLFIDLLFSEYFQVYRVINTQTIIKILEFVNSIKNMRGRTKRELAMKSILDTSFLKDFEAAETEKDKTVLIEKKLEEINVSLNARVAEKESEIGKLKEEIGNQIEKTSESALSIKRLEIIVGDLLKEKSRLSEEIGILKTEVDMSHINKDIVYEEVKDEIRKNVLLDLANYSAFFLLGLSALFFGAVSIKMFWDLVLIWRVLFVVLAVLIAVLLMFWLRVKWLTIGIIAGIIGAILAAIQIVISV